MIKVNRSIAGRLGLLVLGFALFSQLGSAALAADEAHGNPGQFVENIRKGLSGISKFFWSPKGLSAEPQASAENSAPDTPPAKIVTKKAAPEVAPSAMTALAPRGTGAEKPAQAKVVATAEVKTVPKTQSAKIAKGAATATPVKKEIEQSSSSKSVQMTASKLTKQDVSVAPVVQKSALPDGKPVKSKSAALAEALPKAMKPSNRNISKERIAVQPAAQKTVAQKTAAKRVATTTKTAELEKSDSAPVAGLSVAPKSAGKTAVESATAKPLLAHKTAKPATKPAVKTVEKPLSRQSVVKKNTHATKGPADLGGPKQMMAKVDKAKKILKAPLQAKAPAVKAAEKKRQIVAPVVKKAAQKEPGVKARTVKKAEISKKVQAQQKGIASPENISRLAETEKRKAKPKGTYIWLPGKGSPLFARYGRSGIPASRLLSGGNAERKDGRWVFAPYKAGLLPGIYGLSEQINKVGDEEIWVGRGRAWVYVFGKKRTYSSFFSPDKSRAKKVAQATKAGSTVKKRPVLKKTKGAPQRSAVGKQSRLSRKVASAAPTISQQSSNKQSPQDRMPPKTGAGKTVKNGNWEKKNGRWVYRGKRAAAQALSTKPASKHSAKKLEQSRQQASRTLKGGWVYRNNRWTYMTPLSQRKQKTMTSSKERGILAHSETGKKRQARISQPRISQQRHKMSSRHGPALRSQSAAGGAQAKAMRTQKSWVRRDNRWVYASAPPSQGGGVKITGQAGVRARAGRGIAEKRAASEGKKSSSLQKNVTRMARAGKTRLKKRGQEFLFFVPGPTPGSGGWFAAPVELLRYARKVRKPEYRPKR